MTTLLCRAATAATIICTTTCLSAVPSGGAVTERASTERIVTSALLQNGGARVTTMSPTGTGVAGVDLPVDLEDFNKSTWSHDGTQLLHSNTLVFDDNGELVAFRPAVSAPDGSAYRLLRMANRPGDMYCSAWSIDDSRILCHNNGDIFSFRVSDGRGARGLTHNPYGGQDLAVGYSPDGNQLAWLRERPDPDEDDGVDNEREALFVGDPDGTHARRVTRWGLLHAHELAGANWSPDGTSIVSATRKGRLVEVDVATGAVAPIGLDLRKDDFAVLPDYSPDGQRVVFSMFRNAPTELFVANVDGSGLRRITHTGTRSELSPDWK
jgi:Tol biopolymer transport system component